MTGESIITIILGIAAMAGLVYVVVDKYLNNRTVGTLTDALIAAKDNVQLVQLAHAAMVQTIPVATLNSIMTAVSKAKEIAQIVTPDDIDKLLDAGVDLAALMATGLPITAADVVAAITTPAVTPTITQTPAVSAKG